MRTHWVGSVFKVLFWLLLASVLVGLVTGQLAWALVVGLSIYLGWHLHQMIRFLQWLGTRRNEAPPDAHGMWGEIFDRIYQMQRRDSRMRAKQQLVIDRIQASTAALSDAVVMIDDWNGGTMQQSACSACAHPMTAASTSPTCCATRNSSSTSRRTSSASRWISPPT